MKNNIIKMSVFAVISVLFFISCMNNLNDSIFDFHMYEMHKLEMMIQDDTPDTRQYMHEQMRNHRTAFVSFGLISLLLFYLGFSSAKKYFYYLSIVDTANNFSKMLIYFQFFSVILIYWSFIFSFEYFETHYLAWTIPVVPIASMIVLFISSLVLCIIEISNKYKKFEKR